MKETYELLEVRGTESTIDFVCFAIHFQKNDEIVSVFKAGELMSSLDVGTDNDIVLHSALNAIGAGDLQKLRQEAKLKFGEIEKWTVTHFDKKQNSIQRNFVQLAAHEMGVWSSIKEYFLSTDRTEKEQIYYENDVWCKTNSIMQSALKHLDKETIDNLFARAFVLQKENNIRDIFE